MPIVDDTVRKRFQSKRDTDLADIYERIHQVEVERSYRIIGALDHIASDIENVVAPKLTEMMRRWMKAVLITDAAIFGGLLILIAVISNWISLWGLFSLDFTNQAVISTLKVTAMTVAVIVIHSGVRSFIANRIARKLETESLAGNVKSAFLRNTRPIRSLFHPAPAGWTSRSRRILAGVVGDASRFVQTMNDRFTNPSGIIAESPQAEMLKVVEEEHEPGDEPEAVHAKSSSDSAN